MSSQFDVDPLHCDLLLADLTFPSVAFAAWWWRPAMSESVATGEARSLLAQRSALALNELTLAEFDGVSDWQWADLAELSVAQRLECAASFAAILMAQPSPVVERLERLSTSDRRWALSISSIQPLPRTLNWLDHGEHSDALMGIAELGYWIRSGFEALWDRLLRDFDASDRRSLAELSQRNLDLNPLSPSVSKRVRRCWLLAKHRLENKDGVCQDTTEF